jgi:hypothetical protein
LPTEGEQLRLAIAMMELERGETPVISADEAGTARFLDETTLDPSPPL